MLDCKRVLNSVKADLHVLDLQTVEPEGIESQLDNCMVSVLDYYGAASDDLACQVFICEQ